ncbi:hypothetical protein ACINWC323_1165 [Acinetobacter sp. WC-323]|nr:hypothetical protein ACINWC323_1165 [Acinetobacter sp. WC-323]
MATDAPICTDTNDNVAARNAMLCRESSPTMTMPRNIEMQF